MQTSFHAYIQARRLESEISENDFASVFASSDIRVYPFQIASAEDITAKKVRHGKRL